MKKKKFLTLAVATAIAGTTMLGVTSATSDYMHYQDGTISICDPSSNGTKCITMQDKNLGATKAGTECSATDTGACGDHFQWGNNHGFAPNFNGDASFPGGESTGDTQEPNCENYGPLNLGYSSGRYDSSTFIRKKVDWCNPRNDNLRGGANDSQENNRGFDETGNVAINATGRQGPCNPGYHVPSAGERGTLLKYWAGNYTGAGNSLTLQGTAPLYYFSNSTARTQFQSDFMIPFAGYRHLNLANVKEVGSRARLWSSSPNSSDARDFARYFFVGPSDVIAYDAMGRANGLPVRCFKDSYLEFPSSEDGDSIIKVDIAAFNGGQNTCSGSDFIFTGITAGTTGRDYILSGIFSCAFGNAASYPAVTLQLSGDLVSEQNNVILSTNVQMSNQEWMSTPLALSHQAALLYDQWLQLNTIQTLFQKTGNMIGVATGEVAIKVTVPAGTPDGIYEGTLVLSY